MTAAATLVLACACGGDEPGFDYPLDDELRFEHVAAVGTHNSYHLEPADPVDEWKYSHLPLDQQASQQGVRQFELDLYLDVFAGQLEVYHFPRIDEQTTCRLFVDCLRDLKRWSDANRGHHPLAIMLEPKDGFDAATVEDYFAIFESELTSVWPEDRLVTPALVQGDYASVADALADRGWPTLGQLRGRALFFILDAADYRAAYTHGEQSLDGRLAFVTADVGAPYAAVTKFDNPVSGATGITAALAAGMLIRTRVDRDSVDGPEIDPDRLAAALASGAQFLSTDQPDQQVGDGTPSWCNPVTAPASCTAQAIEDPAFVD